MEPRLQTKRGLRKPNLVILAKKEIIVLDIQIRPDCRMHSGCMQQGKDRERLQHQLTFSRLHKGELVKGDKAVRRAVRKWLRLPADCLNSTIHTPARFGGLGVNSLETLYSTLKESRLSQLSYEEDAAIASNPAVRGLMSYKFKGSVMSSREGLVEDFHRRLDTRGLQGYEKVPAVNSWLDHAPTNLAGHDFQEAVRVHPGCMGMPSRLSRGGHNVDSICKCGSNARMSLPRIAQACSIVSGLRIKRHNNVVLYVAQILKERKFDVIMEPRLQTKRGLRKPDLVILAKEEIIVLDVQIQPDCRMHSGCMQQGKDREVQSAVRS
ncbi:unnamed protein product [Acanthosepion pharaonis]|uniref:Uncharacterized protein n=1 Tax=Acanthosepion pharaonis TaxID=158019 RepID=A0A812CSD3_ACAPH|nr:unnamed protein product [Sepia pharaonis]